ncbi:hypothetical protein HanLR1_Chr05g0192421 [Helianthus annuus]|nr:hypothetical protein HanLR1_Chr05g0192421 [Helianthus annuus]
METLVLGDQVLSISREVLVQEHMKHRLLVQDGPTLLVEVTVTLAHHAIPSLPMVTINTSITRVQDLKSPEINFAGKVHRKVWWWGFFLKM